MLRFRKIGKCVHERHVPILVNLLVKGLKVHSKGATGDLEGASVGNSAFPRKLRGCSIKRGRGWRPLCHCTSPDCSEYISIHLQQVRFPSLSYISKRQQKSQFFNISRETEAKQKLKYLNFRAKNRYQNLQVQFCPYSA